MWLVLAGTLASEVSDEHDMCFLFTDHGEDYFFLDPDSNLPITLTSASPNHTDTISVLGDGESETRETILIRLLFSGQQSTPNVTLDPSETVIVIFDNNGMLQ